jgi:hypothetical protein
VIVWGCWWFSSQQARFLYIPILIMFLVVLSRQIKISNYLLLCLCVALCLNLISVWGANKKDFLLSANDIIRPSDKKLIDYSRKFYLNNNLDYLLWPSHDVAYAQCPIIVPQEALPHTIKH